MTPDITEIPQIPNVDSSPEDAIPAADTGAGVETANDTARPEAVISPPPDELASPQETNDEWIVWRRQTDERLTGIQKLLEATGNQMAFLPPQIRNLSAKLDGLALVISESKHRSLLLSVLGLHDLTEQMSGATLSADGLGSEGRRCLVVLLTQIRQLLEANGLTQIATDGLFDPALHRAIQTAPADEATSHGKIKDVLRPGFMAGNRVLRYAEVVVWQHTPQREPEVALSKEDAGGE